MIRVIYANGCSFTAGSELEQEVPSLSIAHERGRRSMQSRIRAHRHRWSWPSQLATLLGAEITVNQARGGGSNARAVRMTTDYVCTYLAKGGSADELLVCLGFTDLARSERFQGGYGGTVNLTDDGWELLKPSLSNQRHGAGWGARRINRLYYRYLYSEEQAVISYVHQLLQLKFMLSSLGVRFYFHDALMTNAVPLARLEQHTDALLRHLGAASHRSIISMDGETRFVGGRSFEDWSLRASVRLGLGGHPLIEGHREWAELLFNEMKGVGIL